VVYTTSFNSFCRKQLVCLNTFKFVTLFRYYVLNPLEWESKLSSISWKSFEYSLIYAMDSF